MKTSKPFSTISYNTADFLSVKLNDLVNRRKIAFWAYVEHLPEEDEKKAHKHLYIVPNGQINTDEVLLDILVEYDHTHPEKPLGCVGVKSSKFYDWYMYAIHDIDYLASKGQCRKFHYGFDKVACSDTDYLNEEIHQMDMSKLSKVKALNEAVRDGVPFEELLMRGQIPVQQVYAYMRAYEMIQGFTFRNGRDTHQSNDDTTGEILELQ